MRNFSLCVLTLAATLLLSGVAGKAQDAGDAAKGKDIFLKYTCYGCHGFSGQNGPGARLVPMGMSQTAFTTYVRGPRTRQMPSYSTKVLSDAQHRKVEELEGVLVEPRFVTCRLPALR